MEFLHNASALCFCGSVVMYGGARLWRVANKYFDNDNREVKNACMHVENAAYEFGTESLAVYGITLIAGLLSGSVYVTNGYAISSGSNSCAVSVGSSRGIIMDDSGITVRGPDGSLVSVRA